MMKWCLVAAGIKDLTRPADKLSVSQNVGAYFASMGSHALQESNFILNASPRRDWLYLGSVFPGYHSYQLQLGCGTSFRPVRMCSVNPCRF